MRILISNFLGGETSDIFYVHPDPWGDDPIWRMRISHQGRIL